VRAVRYAFRASLGIGFGIAAAYACIRIVFEAIDDGLPLDVARSLKNEWHTYSEYRRGIRKDPVRTGSQ